MKPTETSSANYEIRVAGNLPPQWMDWFDGLVINTENGETLLRGPVADQAALFGLLKKIRDLGLPLVSVKQIPSQEKKMNTNNLTTEMEDIKVSLKLKLAAMWTSFMFLYTYVDHFHLYMPGKIEEILAGKVFTFDITYVFLMVAMFFVAIPVLMIFLSVALPVKVNRWTNIIVATIFIPYMLFNLTGVAWLHMYFAAALEVILLCLIIRYAWKWPKQES
jgi:hypothetical protein